MGTLAIAGTKAISEPGRYIDGDGLMLRGTESGSKNWIFRVRIEGERRDVGLGSFKVATLAEAREKAREYRRLIAQGVDPVAEKKKVVDPIATFRDPKGRSSAMSSRRYAVDLALFIAPGEARYTASNGRLWSGS